MKRLGAALMCLMLLLLAGCELPTINLTGYDTLPEDDFAAFIGCLNEGRYDDASVYLDNYTSLGFASFEEGSIYESLQDCLNASRSFTVLGSSSVHGRDAAMTVELTTLDFRLLEDTLTEASLAIIDERHFETGEIPDDEEIEQIMNEVLQTLVQEPEKYYTTGVFRIEFRYDSSVWRLNCSDELYSALVGYIV